MDLQMGQDTSLVFCPSSSLTKSHLVHLDAGIVQMLDEQTEKLIYLCTAGFSTYNDDFCTVLSSMDVLGVYCKSNCPPEIIKILERLYFLLDHTST